MTKFTAGRFKAEVFLGAQNGRSTRIIELHRNGSGEEMASLVVDFDDLPDILHALTRVIQAQTEHGR